MSKRNSTAEEIPEFDFSRATRGMHYAGAGATLVFPEDQVPLDPEIKRSLSEEAAREGVSLERLVNDILKKRLEDRKHKRTKR